MKVLIMSDAITQALAAAKAEAENTPTIVQPQAASMPVVSTGAPRSLTDFMATASMNVEAYISVSELGLRFGKDKQLHDTLDVEMCFKDAKAGYVVRVNTPSGVQYLNSYDSVTEARSRQNWSAVVADAKKMDGNSYVSDLIELPVRLLEDYKRKEGPTLTAGTVVGLSISYQNAKAFGTFLKEQYPRYGADTAFKVRLSAVPKKGGGNQDYGVFGYEVIDDATSGSKTKKAA